MNMLLLALLCTVGQTDEYVQDFHHDFRGTPLPDELGRQGSGAVMRVEKEGLRITLPKQRKSFGQVGVFTMFPVKGNFEITAAYEILHADQPTDGWGVGATLYVYAEELSKHSAGINRLNRPKGMQTIHWGYEITRPDGKRDWRGDRIPCDAKLFRLRMTRKQQTLTYFWAPGLVGDDFHEIGTTEFVTDDLKSVVLNTTTGSKPWDLDVRFLDLRIRSSIKSLSEADPALSPGERVWQRRRLLLFVLLLGVALSAGCIAWRLRRRRQAADSPSS